MLRLVGIELNPGPKSKAKKNPQPKKKQHKQPQQKAASKSRGGGFFQNLGGLVGGTFGGPAGAVLGRSAGQLLSKVTGFGDYRVNGNTLMTNSAPPSFHSSGHGCVISHREFIKDITGSTTFSLEAFPINPGQVITYPWLSQLAANFEEYRLLGQIFEFRPSSGSAISSTSSALGTVIMATNYDAAEDNFVNKQQMESYEFSTSCVPFETMMHPIECAPSQNVLPNRYIRTAEVPLGTDAHFYDMGTFQIATQGMQSAYVVGELWVTYHVALHKPRIQIPLGSDILTMHISEYPLASATAAAPLGTDGGQIRDGSTITNGIVSPTTFLLTNPGRYVITGAWQSTGVVTAGPNFTQGSNITAAYIMSPGGGGFVGASEAVWNCFVAVVDVVRGTGSTNQINITGLTGMTGGKCSIIVTQISSGQQYRKPVVTTKQLLAKVNSLETILSRLLPSQVQRVLDVRQSEHKDCADEKHINGLGLPPPPPLVRQSGWF